jgi:hypothetical protein
MEAIGPRLTRILAVVLIPEGVKPQNRALDEIQSYLDEFLAATTAMEIMTDFFELTPPSSLLSAVKALMDQGSESLKTVTDLSGSSSDLSKPSVKETLEEKTG